MSLRLAGGVDVGAVGIAMVGLRLPSVEHRNRDDLIDSAKYSMRIDGVGGGKGKGSKGREKAVSRWWLFMWERKERRRGKMLGLEPVRCAKFHFY